MSVKPPITEAVTESILALSQWYYSEIEEALHEKTTEGIVARLQTILPVGGVGEPCGQARLGGIPRLLSTDNLYPFGPQSGWMRRSVIWFDTVTTPTVINGAPRTYRYLRELLVRFYFSVHDHMPDAAIVSHRILGKNKKVEDGFATTKNWIVAILLTKSVVGWNSNDSQVNRLWEMGTHPSYRIQYYLFVLPMLVFMVTEMNPHNHLSVRRVLNFDMSRIPSHIRHKASKHSIWSQEEALNRLSRNEISNRDADMCSGIEFKFARVLSLIVANFTWKYDTARLQPILPWITAAEKELIYEPLDAQHVRPMVGNPKNPW